MDIVEFVEEVCGIKLLDCQKQFLRYLEEHSDVRIIMLPRRVKTTTAIMKLEDKQRKDKKI